jgi:hypothetical protein
VAKKGEGIAKNKFTVKLKIQRNPANSKELRWVKVSEGKGKSLAGRR